MKGVILAGGLGSRLRPLTYATNKHLLPVYNKPMIYYPILTLVEAGITDILIITGGQHAGDFIRVLKNGEDFGLAKLHYAYQDGEGGIADALKVSKTFVGDDSCVVVLGDNIITDDISSYLRDFEAVGGARIFLKEVENPSEYGVVEYEPVGSNIADIVEKPKNPKSNHAVIGLYVYDNTVFSKIEKLLPSNRGELEVTDLNKEYLKEGNLDFKLLHGTWLDCGSFDSLAKATQIMYNDEK